MIIFRIYFYTDPFQMHYVTLTFWYEGKSIFNQIAFKKEIKI
jgi:hypothetical protein